MVTQAHLLAPVRLRPRLPAPVEMRNRNALGEVLNVSTSFWRSACRVAPSRRWKVYPARVSMAPMRSSMRVEYEKRSTWQPGNYVWIREGLCLKAKVLKF